MAFVPRPDPSRPANRDVPNAAARYAARAPLGKVANLLSEFLPISGARNVGTVRNRMLRVGKAVVSSQVLSKSAPGSITRDGICGHWFRRLPRWPFPSQCGGENAAGAGWRKHVDGDEIGIENSACLGLDVPVAQRAGPFAAKRHYRLTRQIRVLLPQMFHAEAIGHTCQGGVGFLPIFGHFARFRVCHSQPRFPGCTGFRRAVGYARQHFLYFFPLPHGHGSLRPALSLRGRS
jgi:hypothetical protein